MDGEQVVLEGCEGGEQGYLLWAGQVLELILILHLMHKHLLLVCLFAILLQLLLLIRLHLRKTQ